jgi:hypothetical protein
MASDGDGSGGSVNNERHPRAGDLRARMVARDEADDVVALWRVAQVQIPAEVHSGDGLVFLEVHVQEVVLGKHDLAVVYQGYLSFRVVCFFRAPT